MKLADWFCMFHRWRAAVWEASMEMHRRLGNGARFEYSKVLHKFHDKRYWEILEYLQHESRRLK